MAYKKVQSGYLPSNPTGELVIYHDVDLSVKVGIQHDTVTATAPTAGDTVFNFAATAGAIVLGETIDINYGGASPASSAITAGDVSQDPSDSRGHTLQVENTGFADSSDTGGRHGGAIIRIGGTQILNVQGFRVSGGTLFMTFGAQALRVAAATQITDSIALGTSGSDIMHIVYRAIPGVDQVGFAPADQSNISYRTIRSCYRGNHNIRL